MIQIIKNIMQNKKHRNAVISYILCVSVISFAIWLTAGKNDPEKDEYNPDVLVELNGPQVPLSDMATAISAGDTILISVYANEMEDVYGYQFNMSYFVDYLEYSGRIYSDIDEILTIFATNKGQHLLIGATMIGAAKGYSGQEIPVCHLEFTAMSDFELEPEYDVMKYIALSQVNVVRDDLEYLENITGWTANITII